MHSNKNDVDAFNPFVVSQLKNVRLNGDQRSQLQEHYIKRQLRTMSNH